MEILTNIFIHIMTIGIPALILILCVCGILCTHILYASSYIKMGLYSMLGVVAMFSASFCSVYVFKVLQ